MEAKVLVDYDNIRRSWPEESAYDTERNLVRLTELLTNECRASLPDLKEIELRIYGGWILKNGQYSRRAQYLLSKLHVARKRYSDILVSPELCFRMAGYPHSRFIGTLRDDRMPPQQKMVDTIIAIDTITLSEDWAVFVATDDDDLIPAVAAAASNSQQKIFLIRRRVFGTGLNDEVCRRMNVNFRALPAGA